MPIIPVEADRVLTHALHLLGTQLFLVQRKNRGRLLDWLSGLPVRLLSLLIAGSTRAGIAQPLKAEVRDMPILPINVHSSPSRSVHLDELWVRQKHIFSIAQAGLVAAGDAACKEAVGNSKNRPCNLLKTKDFRIWPELAVPLLLRWA